MILRWETGRDTIDRLLQAGELQRVPPDLEVANAMLASARNHLASTRLVCAVQLSTWGSCVSQFRSNSTATKQP